MSETTATFVALSAVDYRCELVIPRSRVEPRVTRALKQKQARARRRGGGKAARVPYKLIVRKFGRRVADEVTLEIVQEEMRAAVAMRPDLAVVGEPRIMERRYTLIGDSALEAVVHVALRPEIDLVSHLGEVTRFIRAFGEEDVDTEIERRRAQAATLERVPTGEPADASDVATIDLQPVSEAGVPLGPVQQNTAVHLSDPRLPSELLTSLHGRLPGDDIVVEVPLGGESRERYRVFLRHVRRHRLPELDADFIESQTEGEHGDLARFREDVLSELDRSWRESADAQLRRKMVSRFVDAHPFEVPETLIELELDAMVEREIERKRPVDGSDEGAFRKRHRADAEKEVRWRLLRDCLVDEEGLEVTEDELDQEYQGFLGGDATIESIRDDFERQPRWRERLIAQLLERRVYDALARRFEVVEKSRAEVRKRLQKREDD